MNEYKNEKINPMEFMTPEQVAGEKVSIQDIVKALQFGVPELLKKLIVIYKKSGLVGLQKIDKLLNGWFAIKGAVDGDIEVEDAAIVFNITVAPDKVIDDEIEPGDEYEDSDWVD